MLDRLWPGRRLHSAPFLLCKRCVYTANSVHPLLTCWGKRWGDGVGRDGGLCCLCPSLPAFLKLFLLLTTALQLSSLSGHTLRHLFSFWSPAAPPPSPPPHPPTPSCISTVSLSLLVSELCQDLLLPLYCCSACSANAACYCVGISQPWREGLWCAAGKVEPWPNKSSSIFLSFRDQFILLQPAGELKELSLEAIRRQEDFWSS